MTSGDPHFLTFDGLKFNYMGLCVYTMVQDNQDGDWTFRISAHLFARRRGDKVTYIKKVIIQTKRNFLVETITIGGKRKNKYVM